MQIYASRLVIYDYHGGFSARFRVRGGSKWIEPVFIEILGRGERFVAIAF